MVTRESGQNGLQAGQNGPQLDKMFEKWAKLSGSGQKSFIHLFMSYFVVKKCKCCCSVCCMPGHKAHSSVHMRLIDLLYRYDTLQVYIWLS